MVEYKTVKIPECVYNTIIRVQKELVENGLESVPKEILEKCPYDNKFTIGAIVFMGAETFNQTMNKINQSKIEKQ